MVEVQLQKTLLKKIDVYSVTFPFLPYKNKWPKSQTLSQQKSSSQDFNIRIFGKPHKALFTFFFSS